MTAGAGVVMLVIAGILLWKKKAQTFAVLLCLAAGTTITTGVLGNTMAKLADTSTNASTALTTQLVGAAAPSAIAVGLLLVLVLTLAGKAGKPSVGIAGIALMASALAATVPGPVGELSREVGDGFGETAAAVFTAA